MPCCYGAPSNNVSDEEFKKFTENMYVPHNSGPQMVNYEGKKIIFNKDGEQIAEFQIDKVREEWTNPIWERLA